MKRGDGMDIERLAREAGMETEWYAGSASCVWTPGCAGVSAEQFKAFAALVAEECAKVCDPSNADRPDDWTEYAKVRAECAKSIREKFKGEK